MKKIILSIVAVLAFGYANAQIKTDAGTFGKPTAGTIIMEVTMTPNIAGGGIFSLPTLNSELGLIGIKARKFSSDKQALRVAANLSVLSSGEEDAAGDKEDTEFAVGVAVGMEHHMAGAERLSTYWGYEGNLGYVSGTTVKVDGASTSTFGIGVNAGADYYFVNHIYLGIEVGLGFSSTSEGEETTTVTQTGLPTSTSVSPGGSSSGIGVGANSGLRLGFVF